MYSSGIPISWYHYTKNNIFDITKLQIVRCWCTWVYRIALTDKTLLSNRLNYINAHRHRHPVAKRKTQSDRH